MSFYVTACHIILTDKIIGKPSVWVGGGGVGKAVQTTAHDLRFAGVKRLRDFARGWGWTRRSLVSSQGSNPYCMKTHENPYLVIMLLNYSVNEYELGPGRV